MSTRIADATLAAVLRQPWMITEDGLELILAVVTRTNDTPEALALREGEPVPRRRMTIRADRTAVIPVVGPIVRRADMFTRLSGMVSAEEIRDELVTALDTGSVARIVLAIDSPGGETTGISELAAYIREVDARKPVVAFVEGIGASAAYYLASAAREIVAAPQAIVGSIGVRMAMRRYKEDAARVQTFEFVSSQSPKKNADPATPEGAADIQQLLDDLATVFVRDVATYRGVSEATVLSDFGQGGVMAADRALAAGLIDAVESQEATLTRLAASVPPSPAERAGSTRRATASSPAHAPQEEPVKKLHRAPDAGADAGGSGAAGAPAPAVTSSTPDPIGPALAAERTRVLQLCTVARVALPTELKAAIEGGHDVGAFAVALAERKASADAAGADVHRAAAAEAEKTAKAAVPQTPAVTSGAQSESPEAAATRLYRETAARLGLLTTPTKDGAK